MQLCARVQFAFGFANARRSAHRPDHRFRFDGSGKSTTLAAMIEEINLSRARNIITLESPLELLRSPTVSTSSNALRPSHASKVPAAEETIEISIDEDIDLAELVKKIDADHRSNFDKTNTRASDRKCGTVREDQELPCWRGWLDHIRSPFHVGPPD